MINDLTEAQERERFEAWMLTQGYGTKPRVCSTGSPCEGEYANQYWHRSWVAWLAAKQDAGTPSEATRVSLIAALSARPVAQPDAGALSGQHDFDEPHTAEWYTRPIQRCRKCGVIRMRPGPRRAFHYYGKEHMGTGHHRCPANFAACGTSPEVPVAASAQATQAPTHDCALKRGAILCRHCDLDAIASTQAVEPAYVAKEAQGAVVIPDGFALVPVEHDVPDPAHRWSHMCLAAGRALRDHGFNSNEMVAAATAGEWNSSNLVRQIVKAASKRATPPAQHRPASPAEPSDEVLRLRKILNNHGYTEPGWLATPAPRVVFSGDGHVYVGNAVPGSDSGHTVTRHYDGRITMSKNEEPKRG